MRLEGNVCIHGLSRKLCMHLLDCGSEFSKLSIVVVGCFSCNRKLTEKIKHRNWMFRPLILSNYQATFVCICQCGIAQQWKIDSWGLVVFIHRSSGHEVSGSRGSTSVYGSPRGNLFYWALVSSSPAILTQPGNRGKKRSCQHNVDNKSRFIAWNSIFSPANVSASFKDMW